MRYKKVCLCAFLIAVGLFIGGSRPDTKEQYKYIGSGSEWKAEYTITKTGGPGSPFSRAGDLYNAVVKLSYIGDQDKIKNAKYLSFSWMAFDGGCCQSYDLSKVSNNMEFLGEMGFRSKGLGKVEEPVDIKLSLDGEEEHFELQLVTGK